MEYEMLNNDVTQFIKQDKLLQNRVIGVSAIFFIIYCSYYISGYSSQYHNYIITVFFVCWNICALMEDYYSYSKAFMCKSMFFLVLFLLYYFLMSLFNGTIVYTLKYLVIFTTLYGLVFQCRYYLIRNREREIKFILVLTTVVFWIFSINAIAFYFVNPSAARVLAADYYAFDAIAVGGGYSIAFGAALLSVYVFELLIRKKVKRKGYVLLFVVGILILEVLIFMTESTITLIANLVGLIVAFLRMMGIQFYNISRVIVDIYVTQYIESLQSIIEKIHSKRISFNRDSIFEFLTNEKTVQEEQKESKDEITIKKALWFSKDFKVIDDEFQEYLTGIIDSELVQNMDGKATFIIRRLFKAYMNNPQQLPSSTLITVLKNIDDKYKNTDYNFYDLSKEARRLLNDSMKSGDKEYIHILLRTICDHVAGMTDQYALKQYSKLYES